VRLSEAPQDLDIGAVADAAGVATVEIRSTGNRAWLVSQVSVEMPDAPAGAFCTLRKAGAPITALVANFDAAAGDPPITLRPGETLTVEWQGLTPGQFGRVFVVYQSLDWN